MVEIFGLEAKVFSLWTKGRDNKIETLTIKTGIYSLPIGFK